MITHEAEIPALMEIQYEAGVPVSINGVPMPLDELIESVATIGGSHGIASAATVLVDEYRLPAGVLRVKLFNGERTILSDATAVLS